MTGAVSVQAHLREIDVAIDTAISERDAAALERLLADDFIYTHANAGTEPKREFIATILARVDPPQRILRDIQVEPHADVAITRATIEFIYNDGRPNLYLEYVRVHRFSNDRWLAISHRSFYPHHDSAQTRRNF